MGLPGSESSIGSGLDERGRRWWWCRGERGLLAGERERERECWECEWAVPSEVGTDGRRYGGLGGSLRLSHEPPDDGDGESGKRISSGIGLGGIGEGSFQRWAASARSFTAQKGTDAELKVGGALSDDGDLLCGGRVVQRLAGAREGDAADEHVVHDGAATSIR